MERQGSMRVDSFLKEVLMRFFLPFALPTSSSSAGCSSFLQPFSELLIRERWLHFSFDRLTRLWLNF